MKNNLTVQMIVKNEDWWIWYAISSIIKYIPSLIIFDTGSQDNTVKIIKTFPKSNIILEEKGLVNHKQMTQLRQEQLERTKTDWFMIVDGDEVWPESTINNLIKAVNLADQSKIGVVVKMRVCVGDVLHCQPESAGKYSIGNRKGHLNIRAYKKLSNYHWINEYPNEAYANYSGKPIQEEKDKLIFLDKYYWHLRHLKRSTLVNNPKRKFEVGKALKKEDLPAVFFEKRPTIVPSPWVNYNFWERLISHVCTPIVNLKRRL